MKNVRFWIILVAGVVFGCTSMQTRVGDHLPEGKYVDSVSAKAFRPGPLSVGKERDVTLRRSSGLGLVAAPDLRVYLQEVLQRIVAVSPVTGIPGDVFVLASEDFNAFSTADADIFVSLGLIRQMDSEDELAFVLAHELAHVILGHTDSEVVEKTQRQAAVLTELSVGAATQIQAMRGKSGSGGMRGDSKLKEQNRLLLLNSFVLSPAWTRGQEREADLLGTDLLVRAGYNVGAVDEFLGKLVEVEAKPDRLTLTSAVEEMKEIDWVSADTLTAPQNTANPKAGGEAWVDDTMGKLGGFLSATADKKMQELKEDHPRATERRVDMQKYVAREYGASEQPAVRSEPLQQARRSPQTKEILDHYEQAYQAGDFIKDGNVRAAEKLAQLSVSGGTSNHAFPRYYFSLVRENQGDLRKALQNLELAYSSSEPALRIYQQASSLQEQLGDQRKAIQTLEDARLRFGEPPDVLPGLIQLYRRAGKTSEADRLALHCATKYPKMKDACVGTKDE